jgi:hypothetical protein
MLSLGMLIEAPAEPGLNVLKEIVFMAHHLGLTGTPKNIFFSRIKKQIPIRFQTSDNTEGLTLFGCGMQ